MAAFADLAEALVFLGALSLGELVFGRGAVDAAAGGGRGVQAACESKGECEGDKGLGGALHSGSLVGMWVNGLRRHAGWLKGRNFIIVCQAGERAGVWAG